MIPYKQLSLADIFKIAKINLIMTSLHSFSGKTHIDIDEFIPISFHHFSIHQQEDPVNTLYVLSCGLIISVSSQSLQTSFFLFLVYSKILRDFCSLPKSLMPLRLHAANQDFLDDLQLVFDKLVDITEPICQAVDSQSRYDHL